jgi:hypothetical protein
MRHLGTYKGYDVVEQEDHGHKFLTTRNTTTGQWDELVLFKCRTFDDAKVAIEQHFAYEAQLRAEELEPDQEIDEEALEAALKHIDEMRREGR